MEERFEIVDEEGRVLGTAPRSACHSNPELIHQSVHVLVLNRDGALFLQKRSLNKDIQPGQWDTSVGGHMQPGESPPEAATREMQEELGVLPSTLDPLYTYIWRTSVETERVHTFRTIHDGPFELQAEEIDEGRFWTVVEVEAHLGTGCFTPNFEVEFKKFQAD